MVLPLRPAAAYEWYRATDHPGDKPMRSTTVLAALAVCLLWAQPAPAQKGAPEKSFEQNLADSMRAVIDTGAALFNKQNDYAGCYRLYEGALLAVKPLLGNYPALQKTVEDGVFKAKELPKMADRAHLLRKVIDEVRFTMVPASRPKAAPLWERMGGEANVTKIVDEFVRTAAPDPKVNFSRGGKIVLDDAGVVALKKKLVEFISAATGGPLKYGGLDMKEAHKGMGITEDEFLATASHLTKAMAKYGVTKADAEELLRMLGGARPAIVEPAEGKKGDNGGRKAEKPDPNLAQVKGTVTYNGKPVASGYITFVGEAGRRFSANLQGDGSFEIRRGFPPGEYRAILESAPGEPALKQIGVPERYADPKTSPFVLKAQKGENVFNFQAN
jgi:hemoglobin